MLKINKFLSFIRIILKNPSIINLIVNSKSEAENKFRKYYPQLKALPQIDVKDLNNDVVESIESFFLDGSSLITDLQLLATIAARKEVNSYIEIGTWRGESVHNVARQITDCTTINLSKEEMKEMGWNPKYAEQHGILSNKNSSILHLEANTKSFDFSSLRKKYDLIFIDGDHSYEMVLNDTKKVFEHLVHDHSIVVWHDYAYNPQNIRYEVFQAILDGIGKENHVYLYHPKNSMCAVFIKEKLPTSVFDEMDIPERLFQIGIQQQPFSDNPSKINEIV